MKGAMQIPHRPKMRAVPFANSLRAGEMTVLRANAAVEAAAIWRVASSGTKHEYEMRTEMWRGMRLS